MHDADYEWPTCTNPRCGRQLWTTELGRQVCRPCEDATTTRLRELPGLFQRLNTTATLMRGAQRGGGGNRGSKTPPIPPRLEVLALVAPGGIAARLQAIEDAWRQALGWTTAPTTSTVTRFPVVRDKHGLHVGQPAKSDRVFPNWRTGRPTNTVPAHLTFLLNNLPWAVDSYDSVGQDIDEIRKLHAECKNLVENEQRPGRVKIGHCPVVVDDAYCSTPLAATATSHRVHCPGCDTRWETLGEWRQLQAAQQTMLAHLAGVAA
ncbi:hypothetical protein ACFTXJ_14375 [Streptomyces zhihengii]|uniref:hypothetical protein n=1 Tax=Streptomyces zhihengii TaxID=1818004 RepID=UPI003633AD40